MELAVRCVTLVLDKRHHVTLNVRHSQDFNYLWSFLLILDQESRDEVLHVLRIHIRQGTLLILHNLEDKPQ